jgi:lipopolysaccharide transport system ATP-binding protein
MIIMDGPAEKVVSKYLSIGIERAGERIWSDFNTAPGDEVARMHAVRILDRDGQVCTEFDVRDPITIEMEYWILRDFDYFNASFYLYNERGELILVSQNTSYDTPIDRERKYKAGFHKSRCVIPGDLMNNGQYNVQVNLTEENTVHTTCRDAMIFSVIDRMDTGGARGNYRAGEWEPAAVRPKLEWSSVYTPLSEKPTTLSAPVMDYTNER